MLETETTLEKSDQERESETVDMNEVVAIQQNVMRQVSCQLTHLPPLGRRDGHGASGHG